MNNLKRQRNVIIKSIHFKFVPVYCITQYKAQSYTMNKVVVLLSSFLRLNCINMFHIACSSRVRIQLHTFGQRGNTQHIKTLTTHPTIRTSCFQIKTSLISHLPQLRHRKFITRSIVDYAVFLSKIFSVYSQSMLHRTFPLSDKRLIFQCFITLQ